MPKSDEELVKRTMKRIEAGDANAMFNLGCWYSKGRHGLTQDRTKALELYHRAGGVGNARAYFNIGNAYYNGEGVERDNKKADHYFEIAAMRGHVSARHKLGFAEVRAGNWDKALKHYMIAVGDGHNNSVKSIQLFYEGGYATKEDYTNALRAYQKYLDEIRSEQRDEAAALHEDVFKYY